MPELMAKMEGRRIAKIPRLELNKSASCTPGSTHDPQIFPAFDWVDSGVAKAGDYWLVKERHVLEFLSEIDMPSMSL